MKKIFCALIITLLISSVKAQSPQYYYIQAYHLKAKEYRGLITDVSDSTVTITYKKKLSTFHYSELEKIKVYPYKKRRLTYFSALVGMGFLASSPFKSDFQTGIKTAGIGAGIIILSAAIDVTFRKPTQTISVQSTSDISKTLKKYLFIPPPEWKM